MDATNRDIFISEFIIHYLQSRYPEKYSDQSIVNNYKDYYKLRILKEVSDKTDDPKKKMSSNDIKKLEKYHEMFYGSTDGSHTSSGNNIARDYQIALNSVKHLIEENDNAIRDIIANITSLLETSSANSPNNEIAKMYLDNVVLSPLIIALESAFNDEFKIEEPVKTVNIIDDKTKNKMYEKMVEQQITDKETLKQQKKIEKDEKIKELKKEEEKKEKEIKEKNKEEAEKAEKRIYNKDITSFFDKLTTCYNESENIINNDIYFEAIDEFIKNKIKIPNIDNHVLPPIFETISNLNKFNKDIETKKLDEIAHENERKLKEEAKLLNEQIIALHKKIEEDEKQALKQKEEAELELLVKGLETDQGFIQKLKELEELIKNPPGPALNNKLLHLYQNYHNLITNKQSYDDFKSVNVDLILYKLKKLKNSPNPQNNIDEKIKAFEAIQKKFKELVKAINDAYENEIKKK